MAVATTKSERELYPLVTELLERLDMHVWEEPTIRAGDKGTKTADHVAWRWKGTDLETLAVEVKAGELSVGLAQAVAYAVGFDKVFVAAEEPLAQAGYMAKVLDRLGLGYIRADRESGTATLEREAKQSAFIEEHVRAENDARIRLKHLFNQDVFGEPVRFGADRRGENWGVTGTTSEWQLCGQVIPGENATQFSLLAESKSVGDRAAMLLNARELADWTSSLGDVVLVLKERRHNGFQGFYSGVLRSWTPADSEADLEELLVFARSLSAAKVGPHFQVRADLWRHDVALTEDDARRDIRAAIDRFKPVQEKLNEKLY